MHLNKYQAHALKHNEIITNQALTTSENPVLFSQSFLSLNLQSHNLYSKNKNNRNITRDIIIMNIFLKL